jgi:Zn-dependent protease
MKYTFQAGNFRRIRLSVHWTFVLVIIWFLIVNLFSGTSASSWIWSLIMIISLLASILAHDIAQALAGTFFDIEISRLILLPIGGLPSISRKPKRAWQELLMLAAGPAANLIIAGLLSIFLRPYQAYWDEPENIGVLYGGNFLFQLQFINLSLGLLNLLPVFPMDGGRILDSLLEKKYKTEKSVRIVNMISIITALVFIITGIINMKISVLLIGFFIIFTIPLGKYYHPIKKKVIDGSQLSMY